VQRLADERMPPASGVASGRVCPLWLLWSLLECELWEVFAKKLTTTHPTAAISRPWHRFPLVSVKIYLTDNISWATGNELYYDASTWSGALLKTTYVMALPVVLKCWRDLLLCKAQQTWGLIHIYCNSHPIQHQNSPADDT